MNWYCDHKVIIQGITESKATFSGVQMKAYGTDIVAGISPGNGGIEVNDIPVFDLVEQVLDHVERIDISLIFVPPYEVLDAAREAIAAGIRRIIVFTTQVPPLDTIELIKHAQANDTLLLGPGSHGIIIPKLAWLGTLQPQFYQPGQVGLITTSQYLSYEVAAELNLANIGQSMVVSLGDEPIVGSNLSLWLSILDEDIQTKAIILITQGLNEAAEIISSCEKYNYDKPIVVYTAGSKAPKARLDRDAVTIISNHLSSSIPAVNRDRQIISKLKKAGIKVAKKPSEIPALMPKTVSSEQ